MQRKSEAKEKVFDGIPEGGVSSSGVWCLRRRGEKAGKRDMVGVVGGFGSVGGGAEGGEIVCRRRGSVGREAGVHVVVGVPSSITDVEETPPCHAHAPGQQDQPDGSDQDSATPCEEQLQDVDGGAAEKDGGGYGGGHGGMVQLGEAEGRLAQLAVFLLGVGQPLHETFLVHILDAAAALARVEERLFGGAFSATDATGVDIVSVWQLRAGGMVNRGGCVCGSHALSKTRPAAGVYGRGDVSTRRCRGI